MLDIDLREGHEARANDSDFGALDTPQRRDLARRPRDEALPFRIRVVDSEAELLRVQALRQQAYGRHLPQLAASFGLPDPVDRLLDVTIFYAEDKATGQVVGTARVQSNRTRPLQIERSVTLPPDRADQLLAEITRLSVLPGYVHPVRLALVKASHLYCIAMQIGGVLAGSRRSLLRSYLNLGFVDLFDDERLLPLAHAGGLEHRILFRDTVTSEAASRERAHPDYQFVFRTYHPDIQIFDAVHSRALQGAARSSDGPWSRAA